MSWLLGRSVLSRFLNGQCKQTIGCLNWLSTTAGSGAGGGAGGGGNGGDEANRVLSNGEREIKDILQSRFQKATFVNVVDISGGCGSMYEVYVETSEFKDMRQVKQHQLINEILKDKVKAMHGIRIFTSTPSPSTSS